MYLEFQVWGNHGDEIFQTQALQFLGFHLRISSIPDNNARDEYYQGQ